MSEPTPNRRGTGDPDTLLERLARDRQPGEIESGMLSGSDDGEISATERFEGDLSPEEALRVLDPGGEAVPAPVSPTAD